MEMAGGMLADRYLLCGEAFRGRFLATYAAEDIVLGTQVEVDVIACNSRDFPLSAARLRELLDISLRMRGPHVYPLFTWWQEDENLYAVRAASQGVGLGDLLRQTGNLPSAQVVEIVSAAVQVLSEAYGLGIYYLGLNPYMVFIGARGKVGLARAGYGWLLEEAEPALRDRVSSYRAPETDGSREGTRVSDVFSLAMMLGEMLPEKASTDRLRSLLEKAADPLPQRRPSSPRLILEGLQGGLRFPHEGAASRDGRDPGDVSGSRDGDAYHASHDWNTSRNEGGGTDDFFTEADFTRPVGGEGVADPDGRDVGERNRGLLRLLALTLAGGLAVWLAFAAFSAVFSRKGGGDGGEGAAGKGIRVILPDLQGMTMEEATQALEELGLAYQVREAPSHLWSAGRVVAQEPAKGSALPPGEVINLVVSSGRVDYGGTTGQEGTSPPQGENGLSDLQPPASPAGGTPSPVGEAMSPHEKDTGGNCAPRAVVLLSCRSGPAPLYVHMDASGSYDTDGNIVRYLWRCGDGSVLEGISAQHVFDSPVIPARFQVILEVIDSGGASDTATATVEVY